MSSTPSHPLQGGVAVITGAASGFGLECSRIAARLGMRVVMADVQADALSSARAEIEALGAAVLPFVADVSKAAQVEAVNGGYQVNCTDGTCSSNAPRPGEAVFTDAAARPPVALSPMGYALAGGALGYAGAAMTDGPRWPSAIGGVVLGYLYGSYSG